MGHQEMPSSPDSTESSGPTLANAGSWRSSLVAGLLAGGATRRAEPRHLDGSIYWVEGRPTEGGRSVVVSHDLATGTRQDVGPADLNMRTLVHEYGGAAWIPLGETILGARLDDQRLVRVAVASAEDTAERVVPVTAEPHQPRALRYADPVALPDGNTIWVHERHDEDEVTNVLVEIDPSGGAREHATGHDFVASPTVSADGTRLAYIAWDHPSMPWDHTALWLSERNATGSWSPPRLVVDGPALQQPRFGPDDQLYVISDTTGFWNIHRVDEATGATMPLLEVEVEFGLPSWAFGNRTYDWSPDGALWCTWVDSGIGHIGLLRDGHLDEIASGFTEFGRIEALHDGRVVALAASWVEPAAIVIIDRSGQSERLSAADELPIDAEEIRSPDSIVFDDDQGRPTHAFFFPPRSTGNVLPSGERPPLLVLGHGGPTGCARSSLDLGIQYWTTRGIAVVDVNYGGSTGFGTPYRERLVGEWGPRDMADCVAAALSLADNGRVDRDRLAIKGGSAGGFTTLSALVFTDVFAAGISRYGVADLESLARDTHKFESRYLDSLVGPWPAASDVYAARSPIHHTDRLRTPMIVLQGDEDPVVPPSQAEQLVSALAAGGVPHAYVLFEGESHGFRRAENIAAALEAELSFLGQIFGFDPADDIDPVTLQT